MLLVRELSTAKQAAAYLAKNAGQIKAGVHTVPSEIDNEVARLKLNALAISIDELTAEQETYLHSWQEGTWWLNMYTPCLVEPTRVCYLTY